jgi:hypothetical protein
LSRDKVSVKIARKIQKWYKYFSFLDIPFDIYSKKNDKLIICLLAPPRSGSTLTYQLLTDTIKCSSLRNISNLLYSTPILADKLSSILCKNYKSSYMSSHGFVEGLCGEAEGLKFWEYWLNQGLNENIEELNKNKLQKLRDKFSKFNNSVIITGYLGHVFSIQEIEDIFDNVIFIHLKRDLLSNSYSLLQLQKNGNYSTIPNNVGDDLDHYQFVIKQINEIHHRIKSAKIKNSIEVNYEELCDAPHVILDKINRKALELGFLLELRNSNFPKNFKKSGVSEDLNYETKQLAKYINELGIKI